MNQKDKIALRKTVLSSARTTTFRRPTALTAGTLRVFGLHGSTSFEIYRQSRWIQKPTGERNVSWGLVSQRTFPPSGRVTTLVPFPFFFRRAFIIKQIKVKHKNESIIEKLDRKIRIQDQSCNQTRNRMMLDVGRIKNARTLYIL